jgi:hypothetical protein
MNILDLPNIEEEREMGRENDGSSRSYVAGKQRAQFGRGVHRVAYWMGAGGSSTGGKWASAST